VSRATCRWTLTKGHVASVKKSLHGTAAESKAFVVCNAMSWHSLRTHIGSHVCKWRCKWDGGKRDEGKAEIRPLICVFGLEL
jgi:hypothetical protein